MAAGAAAPIAIITGGSRGLGRSAALRLAARGVDVILTFKSAEAEAKSAVDAIVATGRRAAAIQLDVANSKSFPAFAEKVKEVLASTFGGATTFDYLVNNAGSGTGASFADTTEEQFDEMINVHLKSTFFITQKLLPIIKDGGRIVNITTGLTRFSFPGYSAYATAKGGVETLTHYMARELGARQIAVNSLAPGAIETDFGGGHIRDNADLKKMIASMSALGRVGLPDDIGDSVALLLAEGNRWITGQRIEASGGTNL
eukprot:c45982_g1_i1.p1 GENE.c45982_g1_i1~~c45982_g1_i1.p1  ORF type:complete len:258 (+),score=50.50 c45982_g1_i1:48-821(+)